MGENFSFVINKEFTLLIYLLGVLERSERREIQFNSIKEILKNKDITGEQLRHEIRKVVEEDDE